jgi:hypothetical protein
MDYKETLTYASNYYGQYKRYYYIFDNDKYLNIDTDDWVSDMKNASVFTRLYANTYFSRIIRQNMFYGVSRWNISITKYE